jgi:hypothetical protein
LWRPGTVSSTVDAVEREARAARREPRSASNGQRGPPASASSSGRSQTTASSAAPGTSRNVVVDVALGAVRRVVVELGVGEHRDPRRELEQRAV